MFLRFCWNLPVASELKRSEYDPRICKHKLNLECLGAVYCEWLVVISTVLFPDNNKIYDIQ